MDGSSYPVKQEKIKRKKKQEEKELSPASISITTRPEDRDIAHIQQKPNQPVFNHHKPFFP